MAAGKESIELETIKSLCSKMDQQVPHLTIVLFGSTSAIKYGDDNILLGQMHPTPHDADFFPVGPQHRMISNRNVSVINILDLQEAEFYLDSLDKVTAGLFEENGIHAFVFVLQLGKLTDTDKAGLEWLQSRFGEGVLPFVIILFTYEKREQCDTVVDDLKNNTVLGQLVDKCKGRYSTCSKTMNNQSEMTTLLERIDHLVSDNKRRCYTVDMYQTACSHMKDQRQSYSKQSAHSMTQQDEVKPNREGESRDNAPELATADDERVREVQQLFSRLGLSQGASQKLTCADVLQISPNALKLKDPSTEKELPQAFLHKLLMVNYKARYISVEEDVDQDDNQQEAEESQSFLDFINQNSAVSNTSSSKPPVHPMDVQMAVFHCSDSFLKQLMVTKLSQCQYALPLLVLDPFTREIEFPLWTFRQISKSWKSTDQLGKITSKTVPICQAETPMVAFFRLGSISSSKSQLINSLINEKHNTFFHRNCPGSSRNRLLMDGVVEIAWYCPSGKSTDHFTDCVAFCNLHGDALMNKEQLEILTEMSSVNVVFVSDQNETINNIVHKLFTNSKPLICLLPNIEAGITGTKRLKYKIGLKTRNQSDVYKDLRKAVKECLKSPVKFRLENVSKNSRMKTDENEKESQNGKVAAAQIAKLLERTERTKIKETHLPCQGKLWHDWCQKNKELHQLQGAKIEMQKCKKQTEMKKIREQQHKNGITNLMMLFTNTLSSSVQKDSTIYFLRFLGILLDSFTTDDLSILRHDYETNWSLVLDLKKQDNKSEQINNTQRQLEVISEKMKALTFGLAHILREMGQIYESYMFIRTDENEKCDISSFPKLAAQIIESGFPMELMDGDAAHVPLIWVKAVLDELIKKLGDKRVFVLSVLGIQSSGKSTLLNAMFGLQFAVSAGRCTRGALMQLVKVSDEMKKQLKFDYIVVVDTEGLQTLEIPEMSTRHHDNGLATFVVGVGNMTLINIFGENPAEMQDILQIVVQAFLRMKRVRLHPSCMFVHQNVGDITAMEKTMEGRKRLLENLDKMTQLAAKEEDCSAICFSDVIAFDVRSDVWYFAQLKEGSSPISPQNPEYCENVHELKRQIVSKISPNHGMKLSEFKEHLGSLWNALLNENFVFSFRNTLEIATYRRLEKEYNKWTWSIRGAMLTTQNKLQNQILNEKNLNIEEKDIIAHMKEAKTQVEETIKEFFEEDQDKDILIQWRENFERKIMDLYSALVQGTKQKLDEVTQLKIAREKVDHKKKKYENKIIKQSKKLAFSLKGKNVDEDTLRNKFDQLWFKWVNKLTQDTPSVGDIDIWSDVMKVLSESYKEDLVWERKSHEAYKGIDTLGNYSDYVILIKQDDLCQQDLQQTKECASGNEMKAHCEHGQMASADLCSAFAQKSQINTIEREHNQSVNTLIGNIASSTKTEIQRKPIAKHGYNPIYISEMIDTIKKEVKGHESNASMYRFKREFIVDLCLYVSNFAVSCIAEKYKEFKEANDVRMYLEKERPQYFSIFKNLYSGATAAAVFGEFIVNKLEPSILQAAYDQFAIDLTEKMKQDVPAFSGNRSNLEKHILTALAEEENFENFIAYIKKPREHFNNFITSNVKNYIFIQKCQEVLEIIKDKVMSIGKSVTAAMCKTTAEIKKTKGDVNMWLQHFSRNLQGHLQFKVESSFQQQNTDLDVLCDVVNKGLSRLMSKLSNSFRDASDIKVEMFRKKPEEIMIEHLSQCCWAQCPFCNAICTNTMEDHDGDHFVAFHRNSGINGWTFVGSKHLGVEFCTTAVSSGIFFRTPDRRVLAIKDYRNAGGEYARWNITPDNSEMPYWKWFVCRFQDELEKFYGKRFRENGQIPDEWRDCTKYKAIKSLNEL